MHIYAPFLISWCPSCHSKSFSPSVSIYCTRSVHWFTCCRWLRDTAGIVRAELCRRPHTHELLWTCNEPLRRVRYQLDGLITQRAAKLEKIRSETVWNHWIFIEWFEWLARIGDDWLLWIQAFHESRSVAIGALLVPPVLWQVPRSPGHQQAEHVSGAWRWFEGISRAFQWPRLTAATMEFCGDSRLASSTQQSC